jgi:hypothetical protein
LRIGEDHSKAVSGTVTIGTGDQRFSEYNGIVCQASSSPGGLGCTILDAPLVGTSSLIIYWQQNLDIDAEDGAAISLTSAPVIGPPPGWPGIGACSQKLDAQFADIFGTGAAVILRDGASMSFANGTVQCIEGDGFQLLGSAPSLTLENTTIQNTNRRVYAQAGTATISNSTVWYNYTGVQQDIDGRIDLSGGANHGTNTVACTSHYEASALGGPPSVAVLNTTTATLNASNVDWDTPGPDVFKCDPTLTDCTCEIASCTADGGVDGMDAVYDYTGTIDTTGNGLSTANCAVCGFMTCPPGEVCCPGQVCGVSGLFPPGC